MVNVVVNDIEVFMSVEVWRCPFDFILGRWNAQIQFEGKKKHLGTFKTQIEAALKYDEAAKQIYGSAAKLNFQTKLIPKNLLSSSPAPSENGDDKEVASLLLSLRSVSPSCPVKAEPQYDTFSYPSVSPTPSNPPPQPSAIPSSAPTPSLSSLPPISPAFSIPPIVPVVPATLLTPLPSSASPLPAAIPDTSPSSSPYTAKRFLESSCCPKDSKGCRGCKNCKGCRGCKGSKGCKGCKSCKMAKSGKVEADSPHCEHAELSVSAGLSGRLLAGVSPICPSAYIPSVPVVNTMLPATMYPFSCTFPVGEMEESEK